MKKLLLFIFTVFFSLSITSSSTCRDENAVDAMLKTDVSIKEKDIEVIDGFLHVQGVVLKDAVEIIPAINTVETAIEIERDETGHIIKIISYKTK